MLQIFRRRVETKLCALRQLAPSVELHDQRSRHHSTLMAYVGTATRTSKWYRNARREFARRQVRVKGLTDNALRVVDCVSVSGRKRCFALDSTATATLRLFLVLVLCLLFLPHLRRLLFRLLFCLLLSRFFLVFFLRFVVDTIA
jgi:hypothetical protein